MTQRPWSGSLSSLQPVVCLPLQVPVLPECPRAVALSNHCTLKEIAQSSGPDDKIETNMLLPLPGGGSWAPELGHTRGPPGESPPRPVSLHRGNLPLTPLTPAGCCSCNPCRLRTASRGIICLGQKHQEACRIVLGHPGFQCYYAQFLFYFSLKQKENT